MQTTEGWSDQDRERVVRNMLHELDRRQEWEQVRFRERMEAIRLHDRAADGVREQIAAIEALDPAALMAHWGADVSARSPKNSPSAK